MRTTYAHDGLEFDVTEGGPADGDPVVLLHGFPQRATCWRLVEPLLHQAGLRTYAPDQRGYSPGARPRGRWAYRVPTLVADVVALIERIGTPVHLVGHDWGATVAWGVAASRPDLVTGLTALSVPHGSAMKRAALRGGQALRSSYFGVFNVPGLVEGLTKARPDLLDPVWRRSGMDDEQVARFHREIVDDGALPYALGWYRGLPLAALPKMVPGLGALVGDRSDGPSWTSRSRVPTTYVWSTGDTAISRAAAEACGDFVLADYRYVELEGVSHWIPEEAPGVVAEAVVSRVRGDR
ncbi:alpha/beta hydrolase [Nocardioides sp. Y6]|uniref:Alpha/beta hydrolase n=1 Tax=Nocardioides malaquae TaxID=2773426 RepID=A0ABR9RUZ1_9ACTN|nr:alpha/beta hydrolase [Nocardioides malaquae]MBE7325323.1 alpha/beta hydrolase [Nocardioides malaquae]